MTRELTGSNIEFSMCMFKIAAALILAVALPSSVRAQPSLMHQLRDFVENGDSMLQYRPVLLSNTKFIANNVNSLEWPDGKRRVFSGLRQCYQIRKAPDWYGCEYAYMKIMDPVRGTLFCELRRDAAGGRQWALAYIYGQYHVGTAGACKSA